MKDPNDFMLKPAHTEAEYEALRAALQALADEVAVAAAHGIVLAINNGALIDAVEALASLSGARTADEGKS